MHISKYNLSLKKWKKKYSKYSAKLVKKKMLFTRIVYLKEKKTHKYHTIIQCL